MRKNRSKVESWNLIYYNYFCGKKCCHSKISLHIQKDTIPQLVGLMVLIPGGILTDRMKNKRNMVMVSLAILTMFYAFIGCVPMLPTNRFTAFLISFSISPGTWTGPCILSVR